MRAQKILILFLMGVFLVGVAAAQHAVPTAVSPGATRGADIAIADRCPTFSWGESAGARSYELTVYRIVDGGLEVQPVFTVNIPATALSWTPSLARCLEAGGRYAWSVRAVHEGGSPRRGANVTFSDWSEPSLFQVVAEPVRDGEGERPAPWTLADPGAGEAAGAEAGESPDAESAGASSRDSVSEAAPAGTKLSVDGNVDAVSFSGSGAALTGVDAETLDGIDSTALLQKAECDAEAELEALLTDVANVLTDDETAATAAALAADGADCPAGEFAAGVDASGAAQGCAVPADVHAFAFRNTRLGDGALAANTSGSANTAIGYSALYFNTSGASNTAAGDHALSANTTGSNNTATGKRALLANTTGGGNTASGTAALHDNITGGANTASGYAALYSNTAGGTNTASGFRTLGRNTTGGGNTANGTSALYSNTTGSNNTASGSFALYSNTTADDNTAIGSFALVNNTGASNTALGRLAGFYATTGNSNVFIANFGMAGDTAKIRIGTQGTQMTTYVAGIYGTSLAGSSVVVTSSGQLGVASGATGNADKVDGFDASATATANTLLVLDGSAKLPADITGNAATATTATTAAIATALAADGADCPAGEFAAGVNASGAAQVCAVPADAHAFVSHNTRLGDGAMAANTWGASNTASGYQALYYNTTGSVNTASGKNALGDNTTGSGNTASGAYALDQNWACPGSVDSLQVWGFSIFSQWEEEESSGMEAKFPTAYPPVFHRFSTVFSAAPYQRPVRTAVGSGIPGLNDDGGGCTSPR